jgi:hypothetical protein
MIRHYGGGIGHLHDVCSVDHEQNGMVQDSQDSEDSGAAEDGSRAGGENNVAAVTVGSDSASESETDYDMGSGSERGDASGDSSEDNESGGYATP